MKKIIIKSISVIFTLTIVILMFTINIVRISGNAAITATPVYIIGDTDFDGVVTIKDATFIQLYLANLLTDTNVGKTLETNINTTKPTSVSDTIPTESTSAPDTVTTEPITEHTEPTVHEHKWESIYAIEQHRICNTCNADITEIARQANMDDWDYFTIHMYDCDTTDMRMEDVNTIVEYKCFECGKTQNPYEKNPPIEIKNFQIDQRIGLDCGLKFKGTKAFATSGSDDVQVIITLKGHCYANTKFIVKTLGGYYEEF